MRYYFFFAFVLLLWVGCAWWAYKPIDSLADSGAFGDSFGALSSLFSGLAFAGLIVTILQQKAQINLLVKEQQQAKELLDEQVRIARATARLDYLNTMDEHFQAVIRNSPDNGSDGSGLFIQQVRHRLEGLWEERERVAQKLQG